MTDSVGLRRAGAPTLIEAAARTGGFGMLPPTPATGTGGRSDPTAGPAQRPIGPTPSDPAIADIDPDWLRSRGIAAPGAMNTRLAEEMRLIKRGLLRRMIDLPEERRHSIMVTSARPGEGKTFTAVNLAMSIASERDLDVLLVDADLARPAVLQTLGVPLPPDHPGLVDLLENPDGAVDRCVLSTNIPGLSILGAGRVTQDAPELVASRGMADLIRRITRQFASHVILFDCAPVLATTLPGTLAHHVGQVLFVVEAGGTSRSEVAEAVDLLGPSTPVHLVLNKARPLLGGHGVGPGDYGYGYGGPPGGDGVTTGAAAPGSQGNGTG